MAPIIGAIFVLHQAVGEDAKDKFLFPCWRPRQQDYLHPP